MNRIAILLALLAVQAQAQPIREVPLVLAPIASPAASAGATSVATSFGSPSTGLGNLALPNPVVLASEAPVAAIVRPAASANAKGLASGRGESVGVSASGLAVRSAPAREVGIGARDGADGRRDGPGAIDFDGSGARSAETAASRVDADAARFERYVRDIMGGKKPDQKQTRALLEMFLTESDVAEGSPRALELESRLLGAAPEVSPAFKNWAPAIRRLAAETGTPVVKLEAMIREMDLQAVLGAADSGLLYRALEQQLDRERIMASVERFPDTKQGRAMKALADQLASRSGKSVEEQVRAGAFLYVDFQGRTPGKIESGRDPDIQTVDVVFYVTMRDGVFKLGVYRQNNRGGVGRLDTHYEQALKDWLVAGGIPQQQLTY